MKTYAPATTRAATPLFAAAIGAYLGWDPSDPNEPHLTVPVSAVFLMLRDNGCYIALAASLADECSERASRRAGQ